MVPESLGRLVLAELHGCDVALLNDPPAIQALLKRAAQEAGATVVAAVSHHFSPYGVSGVLVIAESHLSIHTWPEHAYAAVDLFTCTDTMDAEKALQIVREGLAAKSYVTAEFHRGLLRNQRALEELRSDPPTPACDLP